MQLKMIKQGLLLGALLLLSFGFGGMSREYMGASIFAFVLLLLTALYFLFAQKLHVTEKDNKVEGDSHDSGKSAENKQPEIRSEEVAEVEKALEAVCEGRLSYSIESFQQKSSIIESCEVMLGQLRDLISKIMKLSVIISSASSKWSEATEELNNITEDHVKAVKNLVEHNEDVVESVQEAAEILEKINEEYVNKGQQHMKKQEQKMHDNLELMDELKDDVISLDKKSEDITLMTETVNNLAEKTNLLALNASIEAARAGQEGRSFTVIAQKVKELAEDSLSSSKEIMDIVGEIQCEMDKLVDSVEENKDVVDSQQITVSRCSDLFAGIVESSDQIEKDLNRIDDLSNKTLAKTAGIRKGTREQSEFVDYIDEQADRLTRVSLELQGELDQFELIKLAYTRVEETSAFVAKKLLENKLDAGVVLVPLNYAEMYHSIGQNILDGMVSSWMPKTHEKYLQRFQEDFIDLGANLRGAKIGLVVPEYVGIENIGELQGESDDFQAGSIQAIGETAGVTLAAREALQDYELQEWTVEALGVDRMMDKVQKAVQNKEPVVATGWKPHWMFEEYPLKFLADPERTFGEAEEIHTIVSPDLKRTNGLVMEKLKEVSFDMEEYTRIMCEVNRGEDIEKIAGEYVKENF